MLDVVKARVCSVVYTFAVFLSANRIAGVRVAARQTCLGLRRPHLSYCYCSRRPTVLQLSSRVVTLDLCRTPPFPRLLVSIYIVCDSSLKEGGGYGNNHECQQKQIPKQGFVHEKRHIQCPGFSRFGWGGENSQTI